MSEQKGDVYDQMLESLRRLNAALPTAEEGALSLIERIPMYSIDNLIRIQERRVAELKCDADCDYMIAKGVEHNS